MLVLVWVRLRPPAFASRGLPRRGLLEKIRLRQRSSRWHGAGELVTTGREPSRERPPMCKIE